MRTCVCVCVCVCLCVCVVRLGLCQTRLAHPMNRLPGGLPELLEMSDYVCSLLPETPDTKGVLDGDVLRHCAKKVSPLPLRVLQLLGR